MPTTRTQGTDEEAGHRSPARKTRAASSAHLNDDSPKSSVEKIARTPSKASVRNSKTPAKTPAKSVAKTPSKSAAKVPAKTPAKSVAKTPAKSAAKVPAKTPAKSVAKTPSKSVAKTPAKSAAKSATKLKELEVLTDDHTIERRVTRSGSVASESVQSSASVEANSPAKRRTRSSSIASVISIASSVETPRATRASSRVTKLTPHIEENEEDLKAPIEINSDSAESMEEIKVVDDDELSENDTKEELQDTKVEDQDTDGEQQDSDDSDQGTDGEQQGSDDSDSESSEHGDIISKLVSKVVSSKIPVEEIEEEEEVVEYSDNEYEEDSADEEERDLEAAVFGSFGIKDVHMEMKSGLKRARVDSGEQPLFFEDKGEEEEISAEAKKDAAWEDSHDTNLVVNLASVDRTKKLKKSVNETSVTGAEYARRLREQHLKLHPVTWAYEPTKEDTEEHQSDEDELLATSESFVRSSNQMAQLPAGRLNISRLNDANQHGPSQSVVQSVSWHNGGELMMTAGFDKTVRVFKIDGKTNNKVQSLYLPDMPIYSASFSGPTHDEILCVGRRKFFYWVDLETGTIGKIPGLHGRKEKSLESMSVAPNGSLLSFLGYDGTMILASQESKQVVGTLKMNGNVSCCEFSADGMSLYSSGDRGDVYVWDIRAMKCRARFHDEGSTGTRSISVCKGMLAVGSNNGVVNLYDTENATASRNPSPLKAIMNLTTPIDQLNFNHDGQLLAMLSRRNKECLRMFNVNTLSVVSNWPTGGTPLHYASCVQFSPESSKLAIGNDRGRCLLYRLHHY